MIKIIYALLIMATLVVAIIFATANYNHVTLYYFVGQTKLPLSILIFSVFLFGLLFGLMLDAWIMYRQRARIRSLEQLAAANQKELSNLRNLPLRDLE
ncbi:MAG: DUF1049 domain-containing protein [Gammaproteobacteria bacterium]|nr:DUF1049 domain-containing protein [Gammaproteobacteria bacterium]